MSESEAPPANGEKLLVVPVVREDGYRRYAPSALVVRPTPLRNANRFEIRLQSLAERELSHRMGYADGTVLSTIGREVQIEMLELATIELTRPQIQQLRTELSRLLDGPSNGAPEQNGVDHRPARAGTDIVKPLREDGRLNLIERAATQFARLDPAPSAATATPPADKPASTTAAKQDQASSSIDNLIASVTAGLQTQVPDAGKTGHAPDGHAPDTKPGRRLSLILVPVLGFVVIAAGTLLVLSRTHHAAVPQPVTAPKVAGAAEPVTTVRPVVPQPPIFQSTLAEAAAAQPDPSKPTPQEAPKQTPTATPATTPAPPPPPVAAAAPAPPPAPANAEAHPAPLTVAAPAPPTHADTPAPREAAEPPAAPPAAAPATPPPQSAEATPAQPAQVASVATPAAPVATAVAAPHIEIRTTADAWISVHDRSGATLLNRLMHADDSWIAPVKPGLIMTTGNAPGTQILVDGVTRPPLGNGRVVVRDVPLNPDAPH